jgi:hypothetical protein
VRKQQGRAHLFGEKLYAFESSAWEQFDLMMIELTEMKRTQDREFTQILQKIRRGVCDDEVIGYLMRLWNHEEVYYEDPTYLFGRNLEVEQTNRARIDELETDETILFATVEMFGNVHEKKLMGWKKMLPVSEQLTLKEGLTVFRDQCFSANMNSPVVQRINDVKMLQQRQFAEDAGPTAHPIKPDHYIEINNFYTATVYEKGAEVIRMLHTFLGPEKFREGMDRYFELFDGQAVTTEDFIFALTQRCKIDVEQFKLWYTQEPTPYFL